MERKQIRENGDTLVFSDNGELLCIHKNGENNHSIFPRNMSHIRREIEQLEFVGEVTPEVEERLKLMTAVFQLAFPNAAPEDIKDATYYTALLKNEYKVDGIKDIMEGNQTGNADKDGLIEYFRDYYYLPGAPKQVQ